MGTFVAVAPVEFAERVALAVGMLTFIEVLETSLMIVSSLAMALVKLGFVETWSFGALSRLLISFAAVLILVAKGLILVATVLVLVVAVLRTVTAFVGMFWVLTLDGRLMPLRLAQVSGRMVYSRLLVTCCVTRSKVTGGVRLCSSICRRCNNIR